MARYEMGLEVPSAVLLHAGQAVMGWLPRLPDSGDAQHAAVNT